MAGDMGGMGGSGMMGGMMGGALSNAGLWCLGRLQTERDKARVLEGLEGASAQAGARFSSAAPA